MAAIQARNFQSNSLSGVVSISNGFANLVLSTTPFALEGDKSFVIKLRRGSIQGDVVATSPPITVQDNSSFVSLTANTSSVNEGNLVQFTLVTANAVNGSTLFYSVNPVTANLTISDFYNGSNTGYLTLNNNQAVFELYANTDSGYVDETGETFRVQLRTNGTSGNIVYTTANILVTDFFKLYNIFGFVESSNVIYEGSYSNLTITAHNIPVGTVIYYDTVGNVTSSSFASGNTGSFVMNSASNVISFLSTSIVPFGEARTFSVNLRSGSATGTILSTSNVVVIQDSDSVYANIHGGTVTYDANNNYKIHTFTSSGSLIIDKIATTGNPADNRLEWLVVAGGAGAGARYIFSPPGNFLVGGGGGAGGLLTGNIQLTATNVTSYTAIIGSGGGGGTTAGQQGTPGSPGSNTSIFGISAIGGGGGSGDIGDSGPWPTGVPGRSGGWGGSGGGYFFNAPTAPPAAGTGVSGQGYPGGQGFPSGTSLAGGGGGGAGSAGTGAPTGYRGGLGYYSSITGANVAYAAGGAGGFEFRGQLQMGSGSANIGGGGNSNVSYGYGDPGGPGAVIVRYPFRGPVFSFNSVVAPATVFTEGANLTFTINILNSNNIVYYYDTVGNVTSSNFITGNTGSFIANATGAVITLITNTSIPDNETRDFQLQIRETSTSGAIRARSPVITIVDIPYMEATGGNVSILNGYKTHVFTNSNTFTINTLSSNPPRNSFEYMVVAGGGGAAGSLGGFWSGGGGGAGGFARGNITITSANVYTVVIGAGGSGGGPSSPPFYNNYPGTPGTASMLANASANANVTVSGGGTFNAPGGSGGGNSTGIPGQGFPGGSGPGDGAGGGAGAAGILKAGGAGRNFDTPTYFGDPGPGPGRYFAGGGAGSYGTAGLGGGGRAPAPAPANGAGFAGNVNTGGGGGGTGAADTFQGGIGGAGGSGIVVIRYPYN